jgi:hypothetical protein
MLLQARDNLTHRFMKDGIDQSGTLRGFIIAIEQMLVLKDTLKEYDKLKEQVDKAKNNIV